MVHLFGALKKTGIVTDIQQMLTELAIYSNRKPFTATVFRGLLPRHHPLFSNVSSLPVMRIHGSSLSSVLCFLGDTVEIQGPVIAVIHLHG